PAGTATEPESISYSETVPTILPAATLCLDTGDLMSAETWLKLHDRFLDFSGAVLGRSEGQAAWSRSWRRAGRGGRAHHDAPRAQARAICTPLGAKPALACADALADRLATKTDVGPAYPDGLSAREVDVLRLIATGVNNQEIADALSLSVRTVERHITNLY